MEMINKFILGTVQFGIPYGINNTLGKPTFEKAWDMLEYAYAKGVCELDTARAYGDAQATIGKFIKETGKTFAVNTKFHANDVIESQLEQALDELGLSCINTYFYHDFNDLKDRPEIFNVLTRMREQEKIGKIGVSVYTNDQFSFCIDHAGIDVVQIPFNLLDNYRKRSVLMKQAKEKGMEVQARSVFLQGLFMKSLNTFNEQLYPLKKYVEELQGIASQSHLSLQDLALAYVSGISSIDKLVIGVDSIEQLRGNLDIATVSLSQEIINAINDIDVSEEHLLYPYNWQ